MKVIITGVTGFIGIEVLRQCLKDASITSVVALARRDLPEDVTSDKLQFFKMKDFGEYPQEVKEALEGSDGCIWTIGSTPSKFNKLSIDDARKINIDILEVGLRTMIDSVNLPEGQKFRYILCSASGVEMDQQKHLWVMSELRKTRGEGEARAVAIGKDHSDKVDVVCARIGLVTRWDNILTRNCLPSIMPLSPLAAALIQLAKDKSRPSGVVTHSELQAIGFEAYKQ